MSFLFENKGAYSFLTYEFDQNDVIDRFSLGMLTNNKILGLADAYYTNVDNREVIKYNISSRITARNYLSGTVTKKRVLSFLVGVSNAVLALEDYMLDADMLMLDLDYIYVDVKTGETSMVLLPMNGAEHSDLVVFLRTVIFSMQYSQEENSSYVTALMNHINRRDGFELNEFQAALAQLNEQGGNRSEEIAAKQVPAAIHTSQPQPVPERVNQVQQTVHEVKEPAITEANHPVERVIPAIPQIESQSDEPEEQPTKPEKRGFFRWGSKSKNTATKQEPQKKTEKKNASHGFSVPGMAQPLESASIPQIKPISSAPIQTPRIRQEAIEQPARACIDAMPEPQPYAMQELPQLAEETVALYEEEESDETVIMGQENAGYHFTPQLIRKRNNEQIILSKELFRIGRDIEFNDYAVIGNRHVGHTHCHIVTRNGEYYIVDDNSKNHTRVNGDLIPPGTEVKLAHGYNVTVADEDFEFKLF